MEMAVAGLKMIVSLAFHAPSASPSFHNPATLFPFYINCELGSSLHLRSPI
jgi:hypothetical protein